MNRMCSYIPPAAYPVSDFGGSIIWWLVILVVALMFAFIQLIFVYSHRFDDATKRPLAVIVSVFVSGSAAYALAVLEVPYFVLFAAVCLGFVASVARAIWAGIRKDLGRVIEPVVVFAALVFVGFWIWGLFSSMCYPDPFPDYFLEPGVTWDVLDQRIAALEEGQMLEFYAFDPLACEYCPPGLVGHYVVYRCDTLEVKPTGGRNLDLLLFGGRMSLVNASYDRETRRITIDDSCPLEYVEP